jgi:hypothetical protein
MAAGFSSFRSTRLTIQPPGGPEPPSTPHPSTEQDMSDNPVAQEMDSSELGEDITDQVKASKPVGVVVSTRLERELAESLMLLAEQEGKRLSQILREAVIQYVSNASAPPRAQPGFAQVTFGGPQQFQAVVVMKGTVTTQAPLDVTASQ